MTCLSMSHVELAGRVVECSTLGVSLRLFGRGVRISDVRRSSLSKDEPFRHLFWSLFCRALIFLILVLSRMFDALLKWMTCYLLPGVPTFWLQEAVHQRDYAAEQA